MQEGEYESTLTKKQKSRLDILRKAFTNWIKILNIIASFDGLQRLYEFLAYNIAKKNEPNSENQIYWDAKIIKTKDITFKGEKSSAQDSRCRIDLNWSNLSFAGLSLAKIILSDINITAIESVVLTSTRTDIRYDIFLKIRIPWMIIYADYKVKQDYESGTYCTPGKIKLYLHAVDIVLKLSITEIDKNYLHFSELKQPYYFRNPTIDFQYTIDYYQVLENITPLYKGYRRENWEHYASRFLKKNSAKKIIEHFLEVLLKERHAYAHAFTNQIKSKFTAYVIPMPSIFEIIKVIKFILNYNPARSLKYYNESVTKDMEKKFFNILSNKGEVVKFIENSLRDARKYFSTRDERIFKLFKESCLDENDPSVDKLFAIYNGEF